MYMIYELASYHLLQQAVVMCFTVEQGNATCSVSRAESHAKPSPQGQQALDTTRRAYKA
ncbi:hypothetical protein ACSS6W_004849 [Trichoderma asperelloides]